MIVYDATGGICGRYNYCPCSTIVDAMPVPDV